MGAAAQDGIGATSGMTVTAATDLRAMFGPARDQSPRPTCLAFAASDAHAALRAGWDPLSAEWAYYHALVHDGRAVGGGTTLPAMLHTLEHTGQPLEQDWPYIAQDLTPQDTWYKPPAGIATLHQRHGSNITALLATICAHLDNRAPVIVIMSVSPAFYSGGDNDFVIDSAEATIPQRLHAVVAVGYGTRSNDHLLLIRNSWGTSWGDGGHAWLSERYLTPRLTEAAVLK